MQIEIKLDENCKEPKIIVVTNKMTDEINEIMKRLSDEQPKMIAGFKDDIVEVLEPFDIYRIFAASGKVFAETNHGSTRSVCGFTKWSNGWTATFCPNIKLGYYQSEKSQGF